MGKWPEDYDHLPEAERVSAYMADNAAEYAARKVKEATEKAAEFCDHMTALVEHCRQVNVFFGGCGDCGSPWLECRICNKSVDDASRVFE